MNIMQKINEDLLAKQNARGEGSGKITPSSMGRCYRASIWKRRKEPQTNPPDQRLLRVFKVGHIFHEFVQDYLPEHQTEVMIKTDDLIGFADIVLEDEVIDIKSQHSRAFHYMKQKSYNINTEKYTNILQVMTYAYFLNKPKGRLIFISKDDLCIEEYGFFLTKWKPEVEKELKTLRKWWESGKLPPAEPRAYGGKECKYCPYLDKCKGGKK